MIQIPAGLHSVYTSFIGQKGVKAGQHAISLFYEMEHCSGRKTRITHLVTTSPELDVFYLGLLFPY